MDGALLESVSWSASSSCHVSVSSLITQYSSFFVASVPPLSLLGLRDDDARALALPAGDDRLCRPATPVDDAPRLLLGQAGVSEAAEAAIRLLLDLSAPAGSGGCSSPPRADVSLAQWWNLARALEYPA